MAQATAAAGRPTSSETELRNIFNFKLNDGQLHWLRRTAFKRGVSQAERVRQLIDEAMHPARKRRA